MWRNVIAATVVGVLATVALAESRRVLVLPFAPMQADKETAWIGGAVQQNVVAELGQSTNLSPVAYQTTNAVANADVAATVGRSNHAAVVVTGAYQLEDVRVRLMASVVDAASGEVLGTAKVTGLRSNLLAAQDELSEKVREVLQAGEKPAVAVAATQPAAPAVPQVVVVPVVIQAPTYVPPYVPTGHVPGTLPTLGVYTHYPVGYPYGYGYGYGYGYSGFGPLHPYTVRYWGYGVASAGVPRMRLIARQGPGPRPVDASGVLPNSSAISPLGPSAGPRAVR